MHSAKLHIAVIKFDMLLELQLLILRPIASFWYHFSPFDVTRLKPIWRTLMQKHIQTILWKLLKYSGHREKARLNASKRWSMCIRILLPYFFFPTGNNFVIQSFVFCFFIFHILLGTSCVSLWYNVLCVHILNWVDAFRLCMTVFKHQK
jgi:hypothetical protein